MGVRNLRRREMESGVIWVWECHGCSSGLSGELECMEESVAGAKMEVVDVGDGDRESGSVWGVLSVQVAG